MNDIKSDVKKFENEIQPSPLATVGKFAVLAAGGYILWTNRFKIQRFLESNGISTPWMTGNAGEAIASGASKIVGSVQNDVKAFTQPNSFSALAKDVKNSTHN